MSSQIEHLYSSLEFDRVLEKIAGYASSPLGREKVHQIQSISESEPLQIRMQEVSQMIDLLKYDDPFPIHGLEDIRKPLSRAAIEGSSLSVEHIIAVAKTLSVSQAVYRYLGGRQSNYPRLAPYFKSLRSFVEVTKAISKTIDFESKEVKDSASPELAQIRKSIRREQDNVRGRLNEVVQKYKDYLQEPIITLREGRMVIPLREDCKGKVQGFIHDRSSSGATLFIEPMMVFEMNNHIRELQIEEKRETARLLRELTDLIRKHLEEIKQSFQTLCELDALYAIGRFGKDWDAAVPKYNPDKLQIIHGYHPLLLIRYNNRDKVVPLDVTLNKESHQLIITGPNAGGKTVALKTIGLSALMFQCGLPVVANEQSQFPLFDQIFVDIGDLQSLEQDLSTFSAHVARLSETLVDATPNSLILIDEIGTGTDPAEGSTLAMAVLERLHDRKTFTVVTTHQGALKAFAHKLDGAENASMAFDDNTLQPTYQFRMGIPGSSYAFDIANRLGLAENIIQRAKQLVGSAHDKVEKFILELEQKLNKYQQLLSKTEIKKTELEGLTKLYREQYEKLQRDEKKLKRKAMEESKEILARANAVIEESVREIRTRQAEKDSIKDARSRVESVKQEVEDQLADFEEAESPDEQQLPSKGDLAYWEQMNVTGRVISDPDGSGNVWLEAGDLKLQIALKDLQRVPEKKKKEKSASVRENISPSENLRTEIDLRGMTMEEAQPVLDKYLDRSYLSGLDEVRIIHGKGTGALRKKVGDYLQSHPKIEEIHLASMNEGDTGVTIVHFKK